MRWQTVHSALVRGFPPKRPALENPHVTSIMQLVISRRSAFEALMYSQFVRDIHEAGHSGVTRRQRQLHLEYHVRTIEATKQALTNPREACSDTTMTSVLSLALKEQVVNNENEAQNNDKLHVPRQGPLQTLRMLDIYGGPRNAAQTTHISALLKMAHLRGGVDRLEMVGLGHQISKSGPLFHFTLGRSTDS